MFSQNIFFGHVFTLAILSKIGLWLWIAYSLMAFIFLVLVSYFRIKNIWSLFLAGAIFGWIDEGIVVQTAYNMFPLSISFTGLAWHSLITVWIGRYATQKSLLSTDTWSILRLSTTVGFLWFLGYQLVA
jgi:hypothetical protein